MNDLIERLRMQSQQEDSIEEEAIARIEQLEAYNAEHQSVCQLQEQHIKGLEESLGNAIGEVDRLQARVDELDLYDDRTALHQAYIDRGQRIVELEAVRAAAIAYEEERYHDTWIALKEALQEVTDE